MPTPDSRRSVAIIGPYPPFRGGIAHFTASLHNRLERDGFDVIGISFRRQYPKLLFPGRSQIDADSAKEECCGRAVIDSIGPQTWARAARMIIRQGADEVLFMYWMPFFAPAFARMAGVLNGAGVRVSAIVHNAAPHERMPFSEWLSARFFDRCDRLIALSESVASDLRARPVEAPIEVIPHPVYERFGQGVPRADARERLGLADDLELVLFFGLIRAYKGLDVLIEAMGRIAARRPHLHLIVAGEFYEGRRAADEQIQRLGLTDRVTLLDRYIPDDDVRLYFSAANVVAQPYRSATQSGVVQTAFQFDRPVIVTDVGELARMVDPGVDGLVVPPADPDALAEAIASFFTGDTAEHLQKGAAAGAGRMTWERFAARLMSVESSGGEGVGAASTSPENRPEEIAPRSAEAADGI